MKTRLRLLRRTLALCLAGVSLSLGQDTPSEELFQSTDPETLVTLTFTVGFDQTEHYSDRQTMDLTTGDTPFSELGAADLAGSEFGGNLTGSAFADQGVLRSTVSIDPQGDGFYTATSTAAYTDTVTLTAPGLEGQTGTLHLEFSVDGRATGTPATLAAALSLTLIGEDNFALTEPFSQSFGTLGSAFDETISPGDPLTTSLDMEIVFWEAATYGASLGLTLLGEGTLDFSNTVQFTGATVTNANQAFVEDAAIRSQAGLAYGNLRAIPEPSSACLVLLSLVMMTSWRNRRSAS